MDHYAVRMNQANKDLIRPCEGARQELPALCHGGNFQLRLNKHLH